MTGNLPDTLDKLAGKTFEKYKKFYWQCEDLKSSGRHPVKFLTVIAFFNNIVSFVSDIDNAVEFQTDSKYGEVVSNIYIKSIANFYCGNRIPFFKYIDCLKDGDNLNNYDLLKEKYPRFSTENIGDYVDQFATHIINCPICYRKLSRSEDFDDFNKIASSVKYLRFTPSPYFCAKEQFSTQQDFDNAIADLEAQIADLKFKYPKYVTYYAKNWIAVRAEYEAGGISLRQLAKKLGVSRSTLERKSSKESWGKNKPIQLIMETMNETDDNPEETVFDRMKAYAAEIGFEIKTKKFD